MNKIVFITGVSTGFGKEISTLLAKKGFTVYGTCRSDCGHDPLVNILQMDVTDLKAVQNAIGRIMEKEGRIDVLINNAGMHSGGAIEVTPYEDIRLQFETNFMGAIHTIKTVLPIMRKQGMGTIMNISSIGGMVGLPFQGYYSASKFAIEGMSEALRMETRRFNIKVVVINPGDFHTHNTRNRKNIFVSDDVRAYEDQFRKTLSVIEYDENNGWQPRMLARKVYWILQKKRPANRYIIASFEQKLAALLKRLLPSSWFALILYSHYKIK